MSWLFALGGQSTGASTSVLVLLMNIQGGLPLGLAGLISSWSKELSRVFSSSILGIYRPGELIFQCHIFWSFCTVHGVLKARIPKEISPEYSLKGLMLRMKLQYFGHLMRRADSLEYDSDPGKN